MALVGDIYCILVTFPCGTLGQVWYSIVAFPDLRRLSYFVWTASDFFLAQAQVPLMKFIVIIVSLLLIHEGKLSYKH